PAGRLSKQNLRSACWAGPVGQKQDQKPVKAKISRASPAPTGVVPHDEYWTAPNTGPSGSTIADGTGQAEG
ncbi:hypothetical protein, partial [Pseudomonas asplenii]|uniref:hypothetical protein n=1 Tax=Pseudomonas asplenii TaxID=53407 RepID=UPI001E49DEB6